MGAIGVLQADMSAGATAAGVQQRYTPRLGAWGVTNNKYGYQDGCTLWVNKLGLEIIHLNKGQHWEKILGQE